MASLEEFAAALQRVTGLRPASLCRSTACELRLVALGVRRACMPGAGWDAARLGDVMRRVGDVLGLDGAAWAAGEVGGNAVCVSAALRGEPPAGPLLFDVAGSLDEPRLLAGAERDELLARPRDRLPPVTAAGLALEYASVYVCDDPGDTCLGMHPCTLHEVLVDGSPAMSFSTPDGVCDAALVDAAVGALLARLRARRPSADVAARRRAYVLPRVML